MLPTTLIVAEKAIAHGPRRSTTATDAAVITFFHELNAPCRHRLLKNDHPPPFRCGGTMRQTPIERYHNGGRLNDQEERQQAPGAASNQSRE